MAALEYESGCHNYEYSDYIDAKRKARKTVGSLSRALTTDDGELDEIKKKIADHKRLEPQRKKKGKMTRSQKQAYREAHDPWLEILTDLKAQSLKIQTSIERTRSRVSSLDMEEPEPYFCSKVFFAVENKRLHWEWFKNKQLSKTEESPKVIQYFTAPFLYDTVVYRIVGHVHGHYPHDVWEYDPKIPDKYDVKLRSADPYTPLLVNENECGCDKTTVYGNPIFHSIGVEVLADHNSFGERNAIGRHRLDYAHVQYHDFSGQEQYEDQYVQQSELIAYDMAFVGFAALFIISCALCLCISGVVGYIVGRCAGNKSVREYENENIV